MSAMSYAEFLSAKMVFAPDGGFDVTDDEINPLLKPHQKAIVRWACKGGRRAIFAAFGLGKSFMQLEVLRLVKVKTGRSVLQVAPLGVRVELLADARTLSTADHPDITDAQRGDHARWLERHPEGLIDLRFVRRTSEMDAVGHYLANYESIRDGKLDLTLFGGASLDEASVLRGFGGTKTFREFMRLFDGMAYKFVATATPSPNEYIELLAYSAFLEVMDVGQAKTRFFKRNSEKADTLTIHPHKTREFWLWVASWGLFVERPSDLCDCPCHKDTNFADRSSDALQRSNGSRVGSETALGSAAVNAALKSCATPTTLSAEKSSVADASAQGMGKREPGLTSLGEACWEGSIETREVTQIAGSQCVTDGSGLPPSSPIWDNQGPEKHSNASTTTAAMSPAIVDGQREKSRRETPDGPSGLNMPADDSPSPHGPRSALSATGNSTRGTKQAGPSNGCSPTCKRCQELDEGYALPPLEVHWHELPSNHLTAGEEKSGQARLLKNAAASLPDAAREKRESLDARVAKLMELRALDPAAHRVIWHDLEAERHAIERAVPGIKSVWGSQDLDEREKRLTDFAYGRLPELSTKPVIAGQGCNFQRYCAWEIFVGIGHKFNDLIQAVHRTYRFLQRHPVRIDLIYTEAERSIRDSIEAKWRRHEEQRAIMNNIIREYGLSAVAMAATLNRTMDVERVEVTGPGFTLVNNDCVEEVRLMADNSVDLIVTSIPFSTQYEYSPSYRDFGHTDDDRHFWAQMDFLIPELKRVLAPGRIAMIHVKDRIVPGGLSGLGFQTVSPFSDDCVARFRQHGWAFLSRITVTTDVVRENNQTYRLGWTEQCKDGSRMGNGLPEYCLIFRKPPSDNSNGYADKPVHKEKRAWEAGKWTTGGYSRGRWQLDAHGYHRSSGNRLLTPDELRGLDASVIYKLWKAFSLGAVYDFEHHVYVAEGLEEASGLPSDFMLLPPHSPHEAVWTDITRMLSMNTLQAQQGRELHLCPLQFDIIDRAIQQYSEPGEVVFDPFGGVMSVPFRALKHGRKGRAVELNPAYFRDGCAHVARMAEQLATPDLFGALKAEDMEHA